LTSLFLTFFSFIMIATPQPKTPIILGIDPGTRYMGMVVLQGKRLLRYGVHQLRNGERPHDVIGQAKRIVLGYIARHSPDVVATEQPLAIATPRGSILQVISQELHARAKEFGIRIQEIAPREVRKLLAGNEHATKIEVAEALVAFGFNALHPLIPKRPRHSALGLRPKDKYWLHMFDALAVAQSIALSTCNPTTCQLRRDSQ
jgi:Holliday junction resolvasome RuvABC endonuclease subunit